MYKLTHSYEQSKKQNKNIQLFFHVNPCGKVFTHDQQTWKARSRIILDPFCPVHWQTTLSLHRCQATFSSCHSYSDPSKTNFPKLLPQQLKVWQRSTAVQKSPSQGEYNHMAKRVTVWEDKTCLCASRSLSLYSFPNHQRQICTVADKKEVKLLKNWTGRLGVESAVCGVEVKEMPLFSQQHCRGIQVSGTANLNVWLHGLYVSFRKQVNLWLYVSGYSLFVSPPAVKIVKKLREKQKVEMLQQQHVERTQKDVFTEITTVALVFITQFKVMEDRTLQLHGVYFSPKHKKEHHMWTGSRSQVR